MADRPYRGVFPGVPTIFETGRHPLTPLHPATRAGLIEIARRLDPLVLRWGR